MAIFLLLYCSYAIIKMLIPYVKVKEQRKINSRGRLFLFKSCAAVQSAPQQTKNSKIKIIPKTLNVLKSWNSTSNNKH